MVFRWPIEIDGLPLKNCDFLTVRHGFSMALIEIDGLPFLKMHGGSFHGELLVITRW